MGPRRGGRGWPTPTPPHTLTGHDQELVSHPRYPRTVNRPFIRRVHVSFDNFDRRPPSGKVTPSHWSSAGKKEGNLLLQYGRAPPPNRT